MQNPPKPTPPPKPTTTIFYSGLYIFYLYFSKLLQSYYISIKHLRLLLHGLVNNEKPGRAGSENGLHLVSKSHVASYESRRPISMGFSHTSYQKSLLAWPIVADAKPAKAYPASKTDNNHFLQWAIYILFIFFQTTTVILYFHKTPAITFARFGEQWKTR